MLVPRYRLILAFLFLASNVAAAVEITPPTYGNTAYSVSSAVVASNGEGFLTLWTVDTNLGGRHIHGSIADASGTVLTPISFVVMPHATVDRLLPYGNQYVALVRESDGAGALRPAIIGADGHLVRLGAPVPVGTRTLYTAAVSGDAIVYVWFTSNFFPGGTVVAQIISIDGQVVHDDIALSDSPVIAVAGDATTIVVTTWESTGMYLRRFDTTGREVTAKTRIAAASARNYGLVSAATNGTTDAVAWEEQLSNTSAAAIFHVWIVSRVDGSIQSVDVNDTLGMVQLYWSGTAYILSTGTLLIRIAPDGKVEDSQKVPTTAATAVSRDRLFTVFTTPTRKIEREVVTTTPVMTASPLEVISTTLRRQLYPAVASDGVDSLVIWTDQSSELLAIRIGANGIPLSSTPIDLGAESRAADSTYQYYPAAHSVAFGGSTYLVVWQRDREVLARRIDRRGDVLDREPIVLSSDGSVSHQSIAWNGSSFAVMLSEPGKLIASTIAESGTVSARPAIEIPAFRPLVAWDGSRYLLSWIEYSSCNILPLCLPVSVGVGVMRLTSGFVPVDSSPAVIAWPRAYPSRIATDGDKFVMSVDRIGQGNSAGVNGILEIRSIRANTSELQIGEPMQLFTWFTPTASTIARENDRFVVAWRYGDPFGQQRVGIDYLTETLELRASTYADVPPADVNDAPALLPLAGQTRFIISEISTPGSSSRIAVHSSAELHTMPAAPPAPFITSAVGSLRSAFVTWQIAAAEVLGFVIEQTNPYYFPAAASRWKVVDASSRSTTLPAFSMSMPDPKDLFIRMRSFNAGGVSDPTAPFPLRPTSRVRAVQH
jgi:hypothetical protein